MGKGIVVLEEIRANHAWWVRWCCLRGYSVYYMRASSGVTQKAWFCRLTESKKLQQLALMRPVYYALNPAADRAFELVEPLYEETFANSTVAQHLERFFGSPDTHLAFKKVLNEELYDAFYCDLLREHLGEAFPGQSTICLVPHHPGVAFRYDLWRSHLKARQAESSRPIRLVFPRWLRAAGRLQDVVARVRTVAIYLYIALVLIGKSLMSRRALPRELRVRYAITIYFPLREFVNPIRGVGFLLDGVHIRKDNTVFIPLAPLTKAHRQYLAQNGLRLAESRSTSEMTTILKYLAQAGLVLSLAFLHHEWVSRTHVGMLRAYGEWKDFAKCFPVAHFISYCDFGFRHIGRNILLRQAGVTTWFYVDTVNGPDNFPKPDDGLPYRQQIYGFLLYDNFVSWCERHARWNRMLHQRVGRYHNVGCLWSEHIRLVKEGKIQSSFSARLGTAGRRSDMKVVSVFDSWFYEAGIICSSDLKAFIRDLERLLEDFVDIFLVIKEKRKRWHLQEPYFPVAESSAIYEAYDKLEKLPRCFLPGVHADPSEVVAASDLVVAFPFTSVGLEALGARCQAIFYDPTGKYLGAWYDRIPGLVAHGYDELRVLVRRLLYETSPEEYALFLDTHVKGDAESFLDGNAITRFRQLLAE